MTIVIDEGPTLRRDLDLIGYPVLASGETCGCAMCRVLDLRYDVDGTARAPDGKVLFVSYRAQPEYDYQTITVRWIGDRGNADVQLAKLLDGRSRADIYVQGYPSGVAYVWAADLKAGFLSGRTKSCSAHKWSEPGSGGQVFVIACALCVPTIAYVRRDQPAAVITPRVDDPYDSLVF